MTFMQRVEAAIEIVSADSPEGSLRQQSEGLLGTELDEEMMHLLQRMADNVGKMVFENYFEKGTDPFVAIAASRVSILVAGIAIGKRLGAQEGEQFGRITATLGGS